MKFFTLLAFVGFASAVRLSGEAELKWQPEHEYIYSYRGRLLTGLPELSGKHFSGMGIHAKIHLNVLTETRVSLKISQAEFSRFNKELQPESASQDGHNWRFLPLPGYSPVPEETMRLLAQPTIFELSAEYGKVERVIVSGEEPEWSVNFKKALIVLFQTQSSETGSVRTNSLDEYLSEQSVPYQNYWTVWEQSVDGECETRYEMNELPESRIYDEEIISGLKKSGSSPRKQSRNERLVDGPVVLPPSCSSGSKMFEIIKVKNVNKCVTKSSFSFYKPGGYECHPGSGSKIGNCEGMTSRSSITRYLVCGNSEYNYVILNIVNEGELNQDLLGFKSEKMLTGTRQVIKLLEKSSGVSRSHREVTPENPLTLNTLFYEYSLKKNSETLKEELNTHKSILKSVTFMEELVKGNKKEMIKEEMKELVKKIVNHDLFTVEGLPETHISMKALGLSKGFHALTLEEIEQLYSSLKSEFSGEKHYVFKNIFFDTCMMSGTIPSVRFLKKMILQSEMSPYMAESMFLSLAGSVITPTTPLLRELYELVTSSKVKESHSETNLYYSAVLGFSSLVEKACLSDNRNTSYPTYVFGRFCHHDSEIVTEKWIPYLTRELRQTQSMEKKNLYVVALGLLSHKQVLPSLYNVLETPEYSSPLLRTLAVYSLAKAGRHHPRQVLPVLSAVFTNRAEKTEVRVAVFNVLIKLRPEAYYLQKIAVSTWVETDLEILKLVNTAFYSLSETYAMQDVKPESAHLVRKVRMLYPLIRKTGGRFPTTGTVYLNDFLKHLNVGFEKVTSWTSPKESSLPINFYSKLSYFLDNYRYTPLEYGLHLRGTGSLIHEIIEIITGKSTVKSSVHGESGFHGEEEEIVNKVTGEWKKIVEKLNIVPRSDTERPEGALFVNIFETYPIFKTFAKESTESLKHKVKQILRNPFSLMKSRSSSPSDMISYQRMVNLAPTIVQVPSDMGLPISIEVHMPLVMSVKGRFEPESLSMNRMSLKSKFHAMATVQYTGWVGTVCPFTGDYVRTGIDQHATINLPYEFQVAIDRSQQEIKVKMIQSEEIMRSAGKVELFHYHVQPFTVSEKVYKLNPLYFSPTFKVIKSDSYPRQRSEYEPVETTYPILKSLGLGLSVSYLNTMPHGSATPTLIEKFRMYNDNPMNMLRFAFVSAAISPSELPSIRRHFIKVYHNPSQASTKTIEMKFKYGFASKVSESEPIMYHTLEKSSETLEGASKVLPLGIKSKPIQHESKHPRRQQKISEIMQETRMSSGYGIALTVETTLVGSVPRTYTYTLLASFGKHAEIKTKWNLRLESDEHQKVCFRGDIDMPLTSVYDIEKILNEDNKYRFESKIGFGSSCDDKVVKVVGHAKTSQEQKEHAKRSKLTQELKELIRKRVPLVELSKLSEKVKMMATRLDEVEYDIEYERLPYHYIAYGHKFVEFLKLYWLPYTYGTNSGPSYVSGSSEESYMSSIMSGLRRRISSSEVEESSSYHSAPRYLEESLRTEPMSGKVVYRIKFHPSRQTFSLIVVNSNGKATQFSDIRLPFPLNYYFPLYTAFSPVYSLEKTLTGFSYNPVCKVEGNTLSTFDNETVPMKMTDCYHLLTTECGHQGEWSVLISKSREVPSYKVVKIYVHEVPVLLIPKSRESIVLKVRDVEVALRRGETKHIYEHGLTKGGRVLATVFKANDDTIVFKSTWFNLVFNGKNIEVQPALMYKSKLCGLCGNFNSDKTDELMTPRMCLVSKPKLFVDSYAIPESHRRCVSESVKEELRKETEERCVKVSPSSGISHSLRKASKLTRSGLESEETATYRPYYASDESTTPYYPRNSRYESSSGYQSEYESSSGYESEYESSSQCYRRSHHIVYRPGKICISRRPFSACSSECKRVGERMSETHFHCFREHTPVANNFIERVRSGEEIPELERMSVDIVRSVHVPTSCRPTTVY